MTSVMIGVASGTGVVSIAVAIACFFYWKNMMKKQKEITIEAANFKPPPMNISFDSSSDMMHNSFEVESALSLDDHVQESNWDDEKAE